MRNQRDHAKLTALKNKITALKKLSEMDFENSTINLTDITKDIDGITLMDDDTRFYNIYDIKL